MRHAFLTGPVLAAGLLCLAAPPADARSGGPDAYGYAWRDDSEPGVAYAWEDISATGTDITMVADDRNSGFLALSFQFPYRGVLHDRLAACTNGWISLVDAGADSYENTVLPTAGAPAGTLAPFWDDFKLDDGGKMFFQDLGDRAVVSWIDVPYFADVTKRATFQIVLHADGRIRSQIASTTGPLTSATIGIESTDDTDGLTAWFDAPIPPPPYAVQFDPPATIPSALDCAGAAPLACGDIVEGDLQFGVAQQHAYRCTREDLSGREHVFVFDAVSPTSARIVLETISGDPRLILLPDCNPNACTVPAGSLLALNGFVGRFHLVVDAPPGQDGQYRLRVECLPLPTTLGCDAASPIACGDVVSGDLAAGSALQDTYWCSLADYSGREQVWLAEFPVQLPSVTFTLRAQSGNPDLVVVYPCDANACLAPPSDAVTLADPVGTYWLVVDAAPGDEGAYELEISGGAAPTRVVGDTLRAVDHSLDTVTFEWLGVDALLPGEEFAVLRSDGDPRGPFELQALLRGRTWTDPAAPASFPLHVWYYTVLRADSCLNLSAD